MHEKIAKIKTTFLGYEDHGMLTAILTLDYGTSSQGAGMYTLGDKETDRWVRGVLSAAGVNQWEKVAGRTVIALFDSDDYNALVVGLKPLPTEPGKRFMFRALAAVE